MEVHLVLKKHPESEQSPVFTRSAEENKIVFPKFQTKFHFKSISYPENDVFDKVARPLIENKLFKNEDSLLLTLGPTNSGKSHLLFQNNNSIVEQSLQFIFNNIESIATNAEQIRKYYPDIIDSRTLENPEAGDLSTNASLHVSVSMFELYNDNVIDLLSQSHRPNREHSTIVTDPVDSKLTPRNITKCLVNSYKSIHNVIFNGLSRRKTYPTFSNNDSSRSHCFIFINLHKIYADIIETTRFSIVDLAGLERSKSARTSGLSLREAGYTNGSLTELGRCLELISMKQFYKTSLRTNKLTRLVLNDYVKFNHPVCILVTLDPFGEEGLILQTLRYIDPIKYQHLQRKSLLNFRSRSKSINENEQQSLIKEIDRLREKQKLLKSKIQDLEVSIVENENRIRNELYKENEQTISQLVIHHKAEINTLNQTHISQLDQKLQDQLDSFKSKYDDLQAQFREKEVELELKSNDLEHEKFELEKIKTDYSHLSTTLDELKVSNANTVDSLNNKIEQFNNDNESLKIEIDALTLKISDLDSNHKEELEKLESEKQNNIRTLQSELAESNRKKESLLNDLNDLTNQLASKEDLYEVLKGEKLQIDTELNQLKSKFNSQADEIVKQKGEHEEIMKELKQTIESKKSEIEILTLEIATLKKNMANHKELENSLVEKAEQVTILKNKIEYLEKSICDLENENKLLEERANEIEGTSKSTIEFLEQMVKAKDEEIAIFEKEKQTIIEKHESDLTAKNLEIEQLTSNIEQITTDSGNDMDAIKHELEEKNVELSEIVKENHTKMKQAEVDFANLKDALNNKIKAVEKLLIEETERNDILKAELEKTVKHQEKELTKFSEQNEGLTNSVEVLEQKLNDCTIELQAVESVKKGAEEEVAKLQLLCSDLKSEVAEKNKVYEKYVALKTKNAEYSAYIQKLQDEKKSSLDELKSKDAAIEKYTKKIEKLKSKLAVSEEKKVAASRHQSSVVEGNSGSSSVDRAVDKSPRKSINILDTDPLDDIGLPSIMSSPLRPPSFQIHSDRVEKDNTITFGSSQQKKKKKPKKLSKSEQLSQQKQLHEQKMKETYDSPKSEKSDKLKFKPLTTTTNSDLNKRLSLPKESNVDAKIKKRKSSSPLKPNKKKVRKSIGGEDSLENLE